ncbi:MAG: 6-phosphogluconolactonase [Candidatus Sulfotelmatobacter sp.]
MSSSVEVRRLTTPQDLFQAAAEDVIRVATDAVTQRGRFTIALSGGSTPRNLYTLIAANARANLPWEQIFFFWGDERHVPPTNSESNYRMAQETLLSKIPVPPANIYRIPSENPDATEAAEAYEQTLRKFFDPAPKKFPRFDLILLGMGPDGHTASLFPETEALQEQSRFVVANWVEKLNTSRFTLTVPVLNAAQRVDFLVSGADKASALHEVLEGNAAAEKYPSKLVRPGAGKVIWFVDRAAASELSVAV